MHKQFIPCGRCNFCLQAKRLDWQFRLGIEHKHSRNPRFITLTYSDENMPLTESGIPTIDKTHLQKFMKRLRKMASKYSTDPVRYYAVGEYGTKYGRPHYHMLLFNCPLNVLDNLDKVWTAGSIHQGAITESSCAYVAGYVITRYNRIEDGSQDPFALMSRNPGIGYQYKKLNLQKYHSEGKRLYVTMQSGFKWRLPRFFKEKWFTKAQIKRYINELEEVFRETEKQELLNCGRYHSDGHGYVLEKQSNNHARLGRQLAKSTKF